MMVGFYCVVFFTFLTFNGYFLLQSTVMQG